MHFIYFSKIVYELESEFCLLFVTSFKDYNALFFDDRKVAQLSKLQLVGPKNCIINSKFAV